MNQTHQHLFQMEGSTWACFGHDDACGLRAPGCFIPKDDAVTRKGMIDLVLIEATAQSDAQFVADHFAVIHVK